ncbi:Chromatin structure remodeling complex protein sfh1 [Onygenales sp. PD_40]|nr:Chromatin structure remodeling complex protein sfh1 [Onygenales sp. PD_40]KAK2771367.1 Chromatin structure remodeling complex protein sfh1 [Emmonsiellopsis sp. PD_33]KAK2783414.1 Chromatin structure remodeling complex protein sfh1 [Onygenales sp. PD_10]
MSPAQGYITSYSPRLRQYGNALLTPIIPPAQNIPAPRTTKRGTVAVNYAEDGYDDEDFDDSEGPRRPTGLRSLRREEINPDRGPTGEKLGTEIQAPVDVQPNFRDWVVKKVLKPGKKKQMSAQAQLPLTLVPIRIDLEVPAFQPAEPFPLPRNYLELGLNPASPAYRKPEPAPPYRIKDTFLWNLHEALTTPEEFATTMVRELDLPNTQAMTVAITNQIRQQLEEYAGVALHPLFQSSQQNGTAPSRDASSTPAPTNAATPVSYTDTAPGKGSVVASSHPLSLTDNELNPDDAYRCVVNLNINLQNRLYTDKFEWSLLHSQGLAEQFARVTCADLGLGPEWVSAVSHGIYEAVLKLKKEVCESGGLISGMGGYGNEIDNQAANGGEAGWRYDPEGLGDEWEPKVETLSKEEIEKREGDRERQIRRLRRETARFSSTTGIAPELTRQSSSGYFDVPDSSEPMGRGERSKKKRRFRSLSPLGRSGTPGGRGTPETASGTAGYGGGGGTLTDWERQTWRCSNCAVWGTAVWAVRDGPAGPRTLCHNCGLLYERDKQVPVWPRGLHRIDIPVGR